MDPLAAKTVAAATGATLTALTMTPFDVVKTRIQTQRPSPIPLPSTSGCCQPTGSACVRQFSSLARPLFSDIVCLWENGVLKAEPVDGFWQALNRVWRVEGIRGLWKGVGTTLTIAVPSATAYMITYDHLLNVVVPPLSPHPVLVPLFSGIMSRTMVSSIVSPLELIRTNLQATPNSPNETRTLSTVLRELRLLVRNQGVPSLWRGLGPTLWRDVPFSGLYWASYEGLKGFLERRGHRGTPVAFFSGAVSGTLAAVVTSPFDVAKTRRQALTMATGGQPTSAMSLILNIQRTEGMSALFAGLSPRIAKIAPACGIMIACFEGFGKLLVRKPDTRA